MEGISQKIWNWHTIYTHMRRWEKVGVLDKTFQELLRLEQYFRVCHTPSRI